MNINHTVLTRKQGKLFLIYYNHKILACKFGMKVYVKLYSCATLTALSVFCGFDRSYQTYAN